MDLKLGLDIGVASVGWGIIDETYRVIDSGVRLFSERTAADNEDRRTMRGQRRRLRRKKHRLMRMATCLCHVLEIDCPTPTGNIYEIRCRGLREKLSSEELYLAIMHLTKYRGTHFLTADDFAETDASGKTASELLEKLDGQEYVCEIQYAQLQKAGKIRGTEKNHFRNKDYLRELQKLLAVQRGYEPLLTQKACEEIEKIYQSKHEYYEGPGSEKSPTPYGCWRYDEDGNVEHVNLIDIMRGHCTYFPEEKRIAHEAYTACLFNLLNDLNNIKIDGEKITPEQKAALLTDYIDKGKNINKTAIKKVTGYTTGISGCRVDKKDNPIFTEFKGYQAILKAYDAAGVSRDEIAGNREKVDAIAEILTKEKNVDVRQACLREAGFVGGIEDELKKLAGFTQYHALSKRAMELILDDLRDTTENQMQLFHEIGLSGKKDEMLKGTKIHLDTSDWIVSPVTLRAVNETVKVINAARTLVQKQYHTDFAEIVIEMPRDKNGDEQKKRIKELQKNNEKRYKEICAMVDGRKLPGKLYNVLRLLMEQDFKSAYSGKEITIANLLNGTVQMEIDHIIPLSLSFDDSLANKVAVLRQENQDKGQMTPMQYFSSGKATAISKQEFKKNVLANTHYTNRKKANLLYEGELSKDLMGFVGRNLSDTRYASRKVLNVLQAYFRVNELSTKVKVVNGAFTSLFRKRAKLSKNRAETFAHHAQDALIIAGLSNISLIKTLGNLLTKDFTMMDDKSDIVIEDGRVINRRTGEVITDDDFDRKAVNYVRFIKEVEKRPQKYSFKVDRKPNRGLYDQQIKATRTIINEKGKEEIDIVTKYKDIYGTGLNKNGEKLAALIRTKPEKLLMYRHDPQTFAIFKEIVENYSDQNGNPFAAYYAEYGPIHKYAKHGNGPVITDVKYLQKQLGNHRVNHNLTGENKSVYLGVKTLRADIYQHDGKYLLISVPYDMLDCMSGGYRINEERYAVEKTRKKINLVDPFCFSLYKGEMLSYRKDGEEQYWIYSSIADGDKNKIETKFIDKPSPGSTQGKRLVTIGAKLSDLTKYHVDILGNRYPVKHERFVSTIDL